MNLKLRVLPKLKESRKILEGHVNSSIDNAMAAKEKEKSTNNITKKD